MLKISGEQISYELTALEMLGAFSASPSASLNNITEVRRESNPWTTAVLRGIRAPGTGFPYFIMLGTLRHRRGKDFCVVYKRRPVLVLEFSGDKFQRWVIPDTEENLAQLRAAKLPVAVPN